jgi:hypothetical protein
LVIPVHATFMVITPLCDFHVTPHTTCNRPTITTLAYGCRHEHILRKPLCAEHRNVELACAATYGILCPTCYDLPFPDEHRCFLAVHEEPGSTAYDVGQVFTHVSLS